MSSEREFFEEHGWLIVRDAVPPGRVEELRTFFDQRFPEGLYRHVVGENQVWQVLGESRNHPAIAAHLRSSEVAARAADLLGAKRIRLLQDTLLCKPPRRGGRVEWHQDYIYTGYLDPPRSLSVRLALSECSLQTGCLQVLDGSHHWGVEIETRALTEERVVDLLPREFADRAPTTLEVGPGDLTIHHCQTWHCSVENKSERARKTIIAHLFDADCRLLRERLPPGATQFPTDEDGRLSGDGFPLLYDEN